MEQEIEGDKVVNVNVADIKNMSPEEQDRVIRALAQDSLARAEKYLRDVGYYEQR